MILNPLLLHLINSMTAHQNCLVGMHDTSYDTPLTISLAKKVYKSFVRRFVSFHPFVREAGRSFKHFGREVRPLA